MDLLTLFLGILDAQQVSLVTHDADEFESLEIVQSPGQFLCITPRQGAHAIEPDIDLDDHPAGHPRVATGRRQRFGLGIVVTGNDRIG